MKNYYAKLKTNKGVEIELNLDALNMTSALSMVYYYLHSRCLTVIKIKIKELKEKKSKSC